MAAGVVTQTIETNTGGIFHDDTGTENLSSNRGYPDGLSEKCDYQAQHSGG